MARLQVMENAYNHDELVELYRKEKNYRLKERYQALFLMIEFRNCKVVAELIKRSLKTIQNWVNAFNKEGIEGIVPKKSSGRPPRLSDIPMEELKRDVLTHPRKLGYTFSNWEGKSVAYHIKQKFGVELGVRRCQYILHELGFTLQRPRYKYPNADPEAQASFKQEFKKKAYPKITT